MRSTHQSAGGSPQQEHRLVGGWSAVTFDRVPRPIGRQYADLPMDRVGPSGSERWFEELAHIAADDQTGFDQACQLHGIEFFPSNPWIAELRRRFELD
jgi:hypothetical protein